MLFPGNMCAYGFKYDNWGASPSVNGGTNVTPGASNAEGNWTQVASAANVAQDCYWMYMHVHTGATANNDKSHLIDIGVDPAGGTSYTAIIENLVCGGSPSMSVTGNNEHYFPFFIKAGSTIAVRIQGSNATAGSVIVAIKLYGQPSNPVMAPIGSFSQTFGTITNSSGTSFTPGNASDGAWVDLGSVTKPLWWWQVGYQLSASSITAEYTFIEIAWGDATNKHSIMKQMHAGTTGETNGLKFQTQTSFCESYMPVPAGQNIYIRGRCQNAPDSGYNATVVGIGG